MSWCNEGRCNIFKPKGWSQPLPLPPPPPARVFVGNDDPLTTSFGFFTKRDLQVATIGDWSDFLQGLQGKRQPGKSHTDSVGLFGNFTRNQGIRVLEKSGRSRLPAFPSKFLSTGAMLVLKRRRFEGSAQGCGGKRPSGRSSDILDPLSKTTFAAVANFEDVTIKDPVIIAISERSFNK